MSAVAVALHTEEGWHQSDQAPIVSQAPGGEGADVVCQRLSSAARTARVSPHPLTPRAPRPIPSRLAPLASFPHASRLTPHASFPHASRPSPRASRRRPRHSRSGRSAAAPLHVVVPRATCNVQPSTPRAPRLIPSRLTPLASHNTCTGSISTIHPGGMRSAWISGVGSRARRMRCQR